MATATVIEQYCDYILHVLRFSERTKITQKCVLTKFFRDCGIEYDKLTIKQLDDICAELLVRKPKPLKPSSVNDVRRTLRCFYKYCYKYREDRLSLDYELIRPIKEPQRQMKFLYPEDVAMVLKNADSERIRLAIALLYETGMRISELANLEVGDISFSSNMVRIIGKGDKERTAFISDDLRDMIREHMLAAGIKRGHLIQHKNGYYRKPGALRDRIEATFAQEGIKMTPHWLRHTFATTLYRNGADLKTIKELLGHTRIDITDRYLHLTSPELQKNRNKFLTQLAY